MFDRVVYFAHGKESGPWGTKIVRLAEVAKKKGCHVESPDYTYSMDPEERVKKLLELQPSAKRYLILVGSSMGGYVSTVASEHLHPVGLFLLAPAFFMPGYAVFNPKPYALHTGIVHGWNDDVVPVGGSIRFSQEHKTQLHVLNSDHRLIDVLPTLERLFEAFLDEIFSENIPLR